jgi:hypothetical protein
MADYLLSDTVLDTALNYLKNNVTKIVMCSQEPTTYAEANATYALAPVTVASGDFTLANGATDGRKVTVAQKTGQAVTANGTITHAAWLDVANSALLAVTKLATNRAVTTADTITMPAHFVALRDAGVAT